MSIEQKVKDHWVARWREADGRQRMRKFTTKRDATDFLATVKVDIREGRYVAPDAGRERLGDYALAWADAQPWRPQTRSRMVHVIESQIVPRWGVLPVRSLRPSMVQAWVGEMTSKGLAPSTVESYYRVLAAVMRAAKRDRLIHESPTDGVTLPRSERSPSALVPLTVEQVHQIADAVPSYYRGLVLTSAGLGLRQGEACGLTVDRIDFLRGHVTIDRQLISPPDAGPVVFGPPKTLSSKRVITLPDSVREVLAAHIAEFGEGPNRLVFTSGTGSSLRRSVWSKAYKAAASSVGIDSTTHDPRPTTLGTIAPRCSSRRGCRSRPYSTTSGTRTQARRWTRMGISCLAMTIACVRQSTLRSGQMCAQCAIGECRKRVRDSFALLVGLRNGEVTCKRDSVGVPVVRRAR